MERSQKAYLEAFIVADPAQPFCREELCTGLFANWCVIHGECTCAIYVKEDSGKWHKEYTNFNDPGCPLHGNASEHAMDGTDDLIFDELPPEQRTLAEGNFTDDPGGTVGYA